MASANLPPMKTSGASEKAPSAWQKAALALWGLYFLSFPFFLMGRTPEFTPAKTWAPKYRGGVPQPSDYLMAGCMALTLGGIGYSVLRSAASTIRTLGLFVGYVTCVNAAWGTWLGDWSLWKMPLFYAYDFVLFVSFVVLYSRARMPMLRVTVHAAAASVFLQVLLSPWAVNAAWYRQPLFFHNENQLGYFVVLAATLFYLGTRHVRVTWTYQFGFYAASSYLALLSVSKAALAGLLFLALLAVLSRPQQLLSTCLIAGVLLLAAGCLFPQKALSFATTLENRLTSRRTDDSWAGRGYDRITNHPEHVLVGAGEGAYYRFQSLFRGELHSSVGTLLFCYGLVGTMLLAYGIFLACKPDLKLLIYLGPPMVHGLAHQGLRFSLFWVLLAFLCCLARHPGNAAPAPRRAVR